MGCHQTDAAKQAAWRRKLPLPLSYASGYWPPFRPKAAEARVPPEQRTGLSECLTLAGPLIASSPRHVPSKGFYRVPEDVRIAGIDDVAYANLLPTPIGDSSPTVQRNWSRSLLFFCVAHSSRINSDMLVVRALKNSQLTDGESHVIYETGHQISNTGFLLRTNS